MNSNNRIRVINVATGMMSTLCGNGSRGCGDGGDGDGGTLDAPCRVEYVEASNSLVITCSGDNSIRKFCLRTRRMETVLIGS